MQLEKLQHRL